MQKEEIEQIKFIKCKSEQIFRHARTERGNYDTFRKFKDAFTELTISREFLYKEKTAI